MLKKDVKKVYTIFTISKKYVDKKQYIATISSKMC